MEVCKKCNKRPAGGDSGICGFCWDDEHYGSPSATYPPIALTSVMKKCPVCGISSNTVECPLCALPKVDETTFSVVEVAPPPKHDPVEHPAHYQGAGGIEAIDVIEAFALGYRTGNAVKYLLRAGKKDPKKRKEDLSKARWYLSREIAALKDEDVDAGHVTKVGSDGAVVHVRSFDAGYTGGDE